MFPLWFALLGGSFQCWADLTFLCEPLRFSVWFSKWKATVFIEFDNLNDNLPVDSFPSENRLF
jgi:hypothetical protein